MTANYRAPVRYSGDGQYLIAVHEAGHAIVHLLLGSHVLETKIYAVDTNGWTEKLRGSTSYAGPDISVLAELIATAAGEAAVLHLMRLKRHSDAEAIARATADHDHEQSDGTVLYTTLPAGIEMTLASRIVSDHWGAIEGVAKALRSAPDGRLGSAQILAASGVADTEISWDELSAMAEAAMPSDAGLRRYLTRTAQRDEDVTAGFLRRLRNHGILRSPATATRRQINAEIYQRGMDEVLAALDAASGGGLR